jgi:hypothetical protein
MAFSPCAALLWWIRYRGHCTGSVLLVVSARFSLSMLFSSVLTSVFTMLLASIFTMFFLSFIASFVRGFPLLKASRLMVPVPVMAGGEPDQGRWHAPRLDPFKVCLGCAGAVPAIGSAAPIPAPVEEHFLLEAFHDPDSGLHHDQRRSHGQTNIDVDLHLGSGDRRTERQKACKEKRLLFHH